MSIIAEVQERARLAFPQSSDESLYRAVQEGAFLADHLYEGESFLDNLVGRDIRGHLRRVGIARQIHRYCTMGDLPFLSEMKSMPSGNWHWLEITATGAVAHVCRSDDVFKFPVEAESRQDYRLRLQPDLLAWSADSKSFSQVLSEIPKLYAWLTFRIAQDGRVNHLCWGAPAADTDEWIAHINVLKEIDKRDGQKPSTNPTPDPKDALRFREHIAQSLAKNEDKETGA